MEQQKSGEKYRHGHHRVHGSFNSATLIQPTPIKLIAKGPYNTNRRHSVIDFTEFKLFLENSLTKKKIQFSKKNVNLCQCVRFLMASSSDSLQEKDQTIFQSRARYKRCGY